MNHHLVRYVQNNLPMSLQSNTFSREQAQKKGFADVPFSYARDVVPHTLLGLDNARLISAMETRVARHSDVAMGKGSESETFLLFRHTDEDLHRQVELFMEADCFGLVEGEGKRLSGENECAIKLMETQTRCVGDRTALVSRRRDSSGQLRVGAAETQGISAKASTDYFD